mgnify:CR=1 FL=1
MGVPQIPGVQNGDGNTLYTWNYSNKSDTLRFGALVALSNLPSASPLDILVFGEVKAPATTPARKMLGVRFAKIQVAESLAFRKSGDTLANDGAERADSERDREQAASEQLSLLTGRLQQRFGKQVNAQVTVRPELISGVVIRAGDQVIDDSALGKLAKMKLSLLA